MDTKAATSIEYMTAKAKSMFSAEVVNNRRKRFELPFKYEQFTDLIEKQADIILARRGEKTKFI